MRGCLLAKSIVVGSVVWTIYCLGGWALHFESLGVRIIFGAFLFGWCVAAAEVIIPGVEKLVHSPKKSS